MVTDPITHTMVRAKLQRAVLRAEAEGRNPFDDLVDIIITTWRASRHSIEPSTN